MNAKPIDGRSPRAGVNPADLVYELTCCFPPDEDSPVSHHVAWHEQLAELWDQIAGEQTSAGNRSTADSALWAADYHFRMAKELLTQRARGRTPSPHAIEHSRKGA